MPPDRRGEGLAVAGMAAVVELVQATIAPTVSLYVNDWNEPARRAYERVGFRETAGSRPSCSEHRVCPGAGCSRWGHQSSRSARSAAGSATVSRGRGAAQVPERQIDPDPVDEPRRTAAWSALRRPKVIPRSASGQVRRTGRLDERVVA